MYDKETLKAALISMGEEKYAGFQQKLVPGTDPDRIIGIRVPVLRAFAADFYKDPYSDVFLKELPHYYYDENMLHGMLTAFEKDYDRCIEKLDAFLPYVDNWAVCDTMTPKVFKKHKGQLLEKIMEWTKSDKTYTIRFGIEMLMAFYLDADFKPEYLEIPAGIRSEEYYVNMMTAWYFATALAKQWDSAVTVLQQNRLDKWTHNKTIQKAVESFRVSDTQKEYLKTLKR